MIRLKTCRGLAYKQNGAGRSRREQENTLGFLCQPLTFFVCIMCMRKQKEDL